MFSEYKRIKSSILKVEKSVQKAGRTLSSEEGARHKYLSENKKGFSELLALKNNIQILIQGKRKLLGELKLGVDSFFEKTATYFSLGSIEEARTLLAFRPIDVLIFLFLIFEVCFTFVLAKEYYSDPTWENTIKSLIWSFGILIGSYSLKRLTPYLPSMTKYVYYFLFIFSFSSSVYHISKVTSAQDLFKSFNTEEEIVKENGEKKPVLVYEKLKSGEEREREELFFRISILLTLITGGLSLGCITREPTEHREALKISQATQPYSDLKREIDGLEIFYTKVDSETQLNSKIGNKELSLRAFSRYLIGLNSKWSRIFNSSFKRKKKEELVLLKMTELENQKEDVPNSPPDLGPKVGLGNLKITDSHPTTIN